MWLLEAFPALLIALTLASCGSHADNKAFVREHVEDLKVRTIPERSRVIANSEVKFEDWGVSANWRFETEMSEADYRSWVQRQLPSELSEVKVKGHSLMLLREFEGDSQSLTLETVSEKPQLQIKVDLRILPK
jgi:hypothetical protein